MSRRLNTCMAALLGAASFVAAAARPAAAQPLPLPVDETNVLILIDVTGSMTAMSGSMAPGEEAMTRLEVGRTAAYDWLINHTNNLISPEFAIWEFSSSPGTSQNYRLLRDFTSNKIQAIAAVGMASQRQDATPLAGTICDAVDRLQNYENGKMVTVGGVTRAARIQRRIYLVTDGLENATPDTNDCWGPGATMQTVYPNYDWGSWQWKVLNKLKTGNANTPSPAPFDYIMDVEHILTSFISSADAFAAHRAAAELEGVSHQFKAGVTPASTVEDDVNLLRGLATQSGGVYTQLAPNPQGVISFRIAGDANDNGCVDMDDYAIFVQAYGFQVNLSFPATLQSDFNGDGWVDDDDYMLLIQHWGEGC